MGLCVAHQFRMLHKVIGKEAEDTVVKSSKFLSPDTVGIRRHCSLRLKTVYYICNKDFVKFSFNPTIDSEASCWADLSWSDRTIQRQPTEGAERLAWGIGGFLLARWKKISCHPCFQTEMLNLKAQKQQQEDWRKIRPKILPRTFRIRLSAKNFKTILLRVI